MNYQELREEIEISITNAKQKAKSEFDLAYQALEAVEKNLLAYVDKLECKQDDEVARMFAHLEEVETRRMLDDENYFSKITEQLNNLTIRK
jgi:phosphate uptake regulator